MGTPANVVLDVGLLWVAPLGTTEPTGNATAQPSPLAGFRAIGYTDAGSKFIHTPSLVEILVEEELYPVRWATTKVNGAVEFVMDEMTRQNLQFALNSGANGVNDTTTLEPPAPGTELRTMIMWESTTIGERWLFRQCIQTGAMTIERRKAPNKSMMTCHFEMEKPLNLQPFKVYPSPVGSIGQPGSLV